MTKGFSMIEIIFVIVIIGILSAIALPKFEQTINITNIQKVKQELQKVRIGIQNKISNDLISGNYKCPELETNLTDKVVFDKVLVNSIPTKDDGILWDDETNTTDYTEYNVTINNKSFEMDYNKTNFKKGCPFVCVDNKNKLCNQILK